MHLSGPESALSNAANSQPASKPPHLCIWVDRGELCHQPGSGRMVAPPGHSALGTHWSQVLLRGSSEYCPRGHDMHASPELLVTSPWLQGTTWTVTLTGRTCGKPGTVKLKVYVPAAAIQHSEHPLEQDGRQQPADTSWPATCLSTSQVYPVPLYS